MAHLEHRELEALLKGPTATDWQSWGLNHHHPCVSDGFYGAETDYSKSKIVREGRTLLTLLSVKACEHAKNLAITLDYTIS